MSVAAVPTPGWLPTVRLDGHGVLSEGPQTGAQVFGLPTWFKLNNRTKVRKLRQMVGEYDMDPRMRWYTVNKVLRPAGVEPRDWKGQAQAIVNWVQNRVYYTNEKGEQLQSPWRTIEVGTGDCDDASILIATMASSIGLGYRFVLSGLDRWGRPVRWIEGTPFKRANYQHIYVQLGWPPGHPRRWMSAEGTMDVPLGYDTVVHGLSVDREGRPSPNRAAVQALSSRALGGAYGATVLRPTGTMDPRMFSMIPGASMPSGRRPYRVQGSGRPTAYGGLPYGQEVATIDPVGASVLVPETYEEEEETLFTKRFWRRAGLSAIEGVVGAVAIWMVMEYIERRRK